MFGKCCPGKGPVSSALKNKPFVIYPKHFSPNILITFNLTLSLKFISLWICCVKKILLHFCPTLGLWQKFYVKIQRVQAVSSTTTTKTKTSRTTPKTSTTTATTSTSTSTTSKLQLQQVQVQVQLQLQQVQLEKQLQQVQVKLYLQQVQV